MKNTNKKAKTSPETSSKLSPKEEVSILRKHILNCPDIPSNSPILSSLLDTLDKQLQKIARDERLRKKFSQTSSTNACCSDDDEDIVTIHPPSSSTIATTSTSSKQSPHPPNDEKDDDMEWLSVESNGTNNDHNSTPTPLQTTPSPLGQTLAKNAIHLLSTNDTTVNSPLSAITAALHAAITTLEFKCTGTPSPSPPSDGFAPPIRDIRSFLPTTWDAPPKHTIRPTSLALRYRKDGVGAVVLRVRHLPDAAEESTMRVSFGAEGEGDKVLEEGLERFVNVTAFERGMANAKGGRIAPALYYKNLGGLMTQFARIFDLGSVAEGEGGERMDVGRTTRQPANRGGTFRPNPAAGESTTLRDFREKSIHSPLDDSFNPHPSPHLADFGISRPNYGDFHGDLLPGGGGFAVDPLQGGNLMGPNHPALWGGGGRGGGLGMRPRFDPYGPPGGPTGGGGGPGRGGRGRGRNLGNPNPDHMRPPEGLGDDMFM